MKDLIASNTRIQIISRYAPAPNRSGPFSYLFDLMRYLASQECTLELLVLDPWFDEGRLHPAVNEMASVSVMRLEAPKTSSRQPRSLKASLRPVYTRLPDRVAGLMRRCLYGLKQQDIPGVHQHDALATEQEIEFIRQCINTCSPDVILLNHTCLGNTIAHLQIDDSTLTAILTHQIESKKSKDFQRLGMQSRDSSWEEARETDLLNSADILLAIQKEDAAILRTMAPRSEVLCLPMSAELHQHGSSAQIPGRCLFVGSDIEHNVYGLCWFLEEVRPLINDVLPESELHVCGTVCSQITGSYPNVKLLGRVENLDREYAEAELCIIPLIAGSGLKIKLVEALSHGRACVSTSVGVQGVQELDGKAVLVKNHPRDFATAVITLLQNSVLRESLEKKARQYVVERLSPEQSYQPFLRRIRQHIERNLEKREMI